jgi:hypothetical protein
MAFKMKRPMFAGTAAHKSALKSIRAVHLATGTDPDHGKGGKGKDKTTLFVDKEEKETKEGVSDFGSRRDAGEYKSDKDMTGPQNGTDKKADDQKVKDTKGKKLGEKSDYEKAKEKDSNLDKYIRIRDNENSSPEEKADAQDKINEAYGRGPTDRGDKVRKKKEEEKKADSSKPTEKADTSGDTKTDKIAKGEKPEGTEKASGRMKPGDPGYMKLPESEKLKIQKAAKERHKKALDAWRKGGKEGKRPRRKDYY